MISFIGILILGFFLGMRHATDPDHVIAVMTNRQQTTRRGEGRRDWRALGHGPTR